MKCVSGTIAPCFCFVFSTLLLFRERSEQWYTAQVTTLSCKLRRRKAQVALDLFFFCLSGKSVKKWCKKSTTPNLKKNRLIFPDRQNFANLQRSPMSCLGDLQILANQITGSCFFLTIKLSLYARHIKIIFKREKYLVVR